MSSFLPFIKRDLAIAAVGVGLWVADRALSQSPAGLAIKAVSVAAGVGSTLTGLLVHEWGHLAGSYLSGGVAYPGSKLLSPFLFNFDVAASTRNQFLWMSVGGFAATAVVATTIFMLAPTATLSGQVALVGGFLGVAITAVAELPVFISVLRGGPLPSGFVYASEPAA